MSTEQPEITHPPLPPSMADPANFEVRADAFLSWFPSAWDSLDAIVKYIGFKTAGAAGFATAAEAASSTAQQYKVQSGQSAESARRFSDIAQAAASSAASSAQNAISGSRLSIGAVTTLAYGENAEVTITGAPGAQQLDLKIPSGPPGGVDSFNGRSGAITFGPDDLSFDVPSAINAQQAGNGVVSVERINQDEVRITLLNGEFLFFIVS